MPCIRDTLGNKRDGPLAFMRECNVSIGFQKKGTLILLM